MAVSCSLEWQWLRDLSPEVKLSVVCWNYRWAQKWWQWPVPSRRQCLFYFARVIRNLTDDSSKRRERWPCRPRKEICTCSELLPEGKGLMAGGASARWVSAGLFGTGWGLKALWGRVGGSFGLFWTQRRSNTYIGVSVPARSFFSCSKRWDGSDYSTPRDSSRVAWFLRNYFSPNMSVDFMGDYAAASGLSRRTCAGDAACAVMIDCQQNVALPDAKSG